jgi:hypothetical protein
MQIGVAHNQISTINPATVFEYESIALFRGGTQLFEHGMKEFIDARLGVEDTIKEELDKLGSHLNEVYHDTINLAQQAQGDLWFNIRDKENKCSYDNLLCYLALREYDLSDLQLRLADHGLSSLEMLESHVLVSIERILKHFNIAPANTSGSLCKINSQDANSILAKRSELLFGGSNNGRRTHIMITLDSSDIFQYISVYYLSSAEINSQNYTGCHTAIIIINTVHKKYDCLNANNFISVILGLFLTSAAETPKAGRFSDQIHS